MTPPSKKSAVDGSMAPKEADAKGVDSSNVQPVPEGQDISISPENKIILSEEQRQLFRDFEKQEALQKNRAESEANKKATLALEEIFSAADKADMNSVIPPDKDLLSVAECNIFLGEIAMRFGISRFHAFIGVSLLGLKGTANASTPATLTVEIIYENRKISISKFDLLEVYKTNFKTSFIRRFFQVPIIGKQICDFAVKNNLPGDLSRQINDRLRLQGKKPLTLRQSAFCNSWMQNNPVMTADDELIALSQLLAEDYQLKFVQKKSVVPNTNKKGSQSSPRPVGPGKGQKNSKKAPPKK